MGAAAPGVMAADEPANVAKYRAGMMKTMSGHMGAIGAVLKGEVSFGGHVQRHANAIRDIAARAGDLLPEGSGTPERRAKPEIWQQ